MPEYEHGVVVEGILLSPYTLAVTAYLHDCWQHLDNGTEDQIIADPFYESGLSDEQIDWVIKALDEEYDKEWGLYSSYHRNRQGCEAGADFNRMGTRARRAMIEGLQRIIAEYHPPTTPSQSLADDWGC